MRARAAELRPKAIELRRQGMKYREIAETLNIPEYCVTDYLKEYRENALTVPEDNYTKCVWRRKWCSKFDTATRRMMRDPEGVAIGKWNEWAARKMMQDGLTVKEIAEFLDCKERVIAKWCNGLQQIDKAANLEEFKARLKSLSLNELKIVWDDMTEPYRTGRRRQ